MYTFQELTRKHPCFHMGPGMAGKGRIHLPVSPGCNISCNFCKIDTANTTENRPGVAAGIITPFEALDVVRKAVKKMPDLTVAGIAGPGDTLATPYALQTFELIKEEFPDMIKCMSTNGLNLPDYADQIINVGIDTLTVTVNAIDPEIEAQINDHIIYHGKRYEGVEAARILIHNQLEGIKKVASAGVNVKVNTVYVPEINGEHIEEVAKKASELGAVLYNIIPLIPQHKLAWCTSPDCKMLTEKRVEAGKYINVFSHCQRCRADAIGVPGGKDISQEIYGRPVNLAETFSHG